MEYLYHVVTWLYIVVTGYISSGSIGTFVLKPVLEGALQKLDINYQTIGKGITARMYHDYAAVPALKGDRHHGSSR